MSSHQPIPPMPTRTVMESESRGLEEASEIIRPNHQGLDDPAVHLLVRLFPPRLNSVEISSAVEICAALSLEGQSEILSPSSRPPSNGQKPMEQLFSWRQLLWHRKTSELLEFPTHTCLQSAPCRQLQPWRANLERSFASPE